MKLSFLSLGAPLLPSILAAPTTSDNVEKRSPEPGQSQQEWVDTKYFHEPGAGDDWGHYDIRYFKGTPVSYEERGDTLTHLIRSYLNIFREKNIETWIAHGTLLGWWWNGRIMPWDWDLDTQVSSATLTWMGQNLNMTLHSYTDTLAGGPTTTHEYLLDVNPNSADRLRGDGQNVIDARWIDTRNGLFIDITGLAETNPSMQPGIWSCKNLHRYHTKDIYPLRETEFEGVPALVPYSLDRVLTQEYHQKAFTKTEHEGHRSDSSPEKAILQEVQVSRVRENKGPARQDVELQTREDGEHREHPLDNQLNGTHHL
ncbi:mannosylphosphate transferase [Amylocarpus encephaloides]|uniref:Mannosylphosphate transferase n=1 Tax=Amylocarpus encephaloides TaxID=45428 RepID=A0A9P7YJ71_9HELO|nr:mannosylphosphate transferase [Amylocarpus encephaloides]